MPFISDRSIITPPSIVDAPRHVVAAAADGDFELQVARQLDGVDDVGHAAAARDQRRPLVDQAVMDFPGLVVAGVGRLEETPRKCRTQLAHSGRDR